MFTVSVDKDKWTQGQQVPQVKLGGKAMEAKENKKLPLQQTASTGTVSTTLTIVEEITPPRRSPGMRPLSPIKPLSPLGL